MNNTHAKPRADSLATTLDELVSKMAESCGFMNRDINVNKVDLVTESNPLIIYAKGTAMPALVYYKNGVAYLYEPTHGVNKILEKSKLKGYERIGTLLYRQWPAEATTIRKVAKAGFKETSSDLKRFLYLQAVLSLVMLLQPMLTGVIFDHVIKLRQYNLIDQVFMGLVAITLGSTIFKFVQNYAMMRFQAKSSNFLQSALWKRVLSFNSIFFKALRLGDLHERIMTIDHLQKELTTATMSGLSQGLFAIAALIFITFYVPYLGLILFLASLVFAGISYLIVIKIVVQHRENTQTNARMLSFLFESVRSIIKIKTSNAQHRVFSRWMNLELSKMNRFLKSQYLLVYSQVLRFVFPVVMTISLFLLLVSNDPFGNTPPILTVGSFITVQMAMGQYFSALMGAMGVIDKLLFLVPQVERSKIIIRELPEQSPDRKIQTALKGKISFQNVSFRYDPSGPLILDNINLTIEPGEWVAIVGPSGAGKSTLLRLILGLETPERGTILLDDMPLQQLDIATVRGQIATVLQHTQLLPGSVYDNLRATNPRITDEEAMALLKLVALYDDIVNMPMGLHTIVMGDGRTFSMGQRQRLVLARCLAKPLSMLLLDEATSSLDNVSQEIILRTLSQLPLTRVMIAHRPSTIHRAERVIVMDKGRIVKS
jgi:ABC-type bacteriocin/lantibiotic exporter with double-glycine peptidase domain